uniref:(northern house mosquito) hypothetical protein n=1 Tax=Culex pipiens TaxID=7175 RepID=A0A8D8NHD0_CULPI
MELLAGRTFVVGSLRLILMMTSAGLVRMCKTHASIHHRLCVDHLSVFLRDMSPPVPWFWFAAHSGGSPELHTFARGFSVREQFPLAIFGGSILTQLEFPI